jgi:hypothetical protein
VLERLATGDHWQEAGVELLDIAQTDIAALLTAAALKEGTEVTTNIAQIESRILTELETVFELVPIARGHKAEQGAERNWLAEISEALGDPSNWATLLALVVARHLGEVGESADSTNTAGDRFSEWHLGSTLVDLVVALGHSEDDGQRAVKTVELMIEAGRLRSKVERPGEDLNLVLTELVGSDEGCRYLQVNSHADVFWFNREAFEEMLRWLTVSRVLDGVVMGGESARPFVARTANEWQTILGAAEDSSYRLVDFLEIVNAASDNVATDD